MSLLRPLLLPLLALAACAPSDVRADEEPADESAVRREPPSVRPELAGDYYLGSGLGTNLHLTLYGDEFTFDSGGCLGSADTIAGEVEYESDVVRLRADPQPTYAQSPLHDLVIVHWETRTYLVPAERMTAFRLDVASGREPRTSSQGSYFLRDDEHLQVPAGPPLIPERFRSAPLPDRIGGTATAVTVEAPPPERSFRTLEHIRVELDAGAVDGVYVGMDVFAGLDETASLSGHIEAVEEDRAFAFFYRFEVDDDVPAIAVGDPITRLSYGL